jgi:hypothetical protein
MPLAGTSRFQNPLALRQIRLVMVSSVGGVIRVAAMGCGPF